MLRESLCGDGWLIKEKGAVAGFDAKSPCSVLSVLMEQGKLDDLYYRENEKQALAPLEKDYEFIKNFSVSGEHMQQDCVDLVFYGLDTVSEIFLNGKKIGSTKNMHRTYRFSVKDTMRVGANELRIVFESPLRYVREFRPAENKKTSFAPTGALPGSQYIRKAESMFGWDWGPKLPDTGIFRDIVIESFSKVRISDVFFEQDHYEGGIMLHVDPILEYTDLIPVELTVSVTGEDDTVIMTRLTDTFREFSVRGENEVVVNIHSPQLWWPAGYGDQPLYTVKISLKKADKVYDEREYHIGLRTIELITQKDETGESFAFEVNGRRIFAKGADYIPEDAIYSRMNDRRTETLVKNAAMANFNFLRVWGGGVYPSDAFYDACDKYGILVWQDMMFACNLYELTPKFERSILAEVHDNVTRLRHHACLALWCGNNEMESGWAGKAYKNEPPALKADYIKLFEYLIPRAVAADDDYTPYWASSPSSGGSFDDPDSPDRGDSHFWDVWHGDKGIDEYRKHVFRFLSEFGVQSFPGIKTVRSFTGEVDRNAFSPVMEAHQKSPLGNAKILTGIAGNFRYPRDFVQLLYVSQLVQAIAVKGCVEHMRKNMDVCAGTLYWQLNDNYPAVSWSSIDYYGRWKLLHYAARRFYAPVAGSVEVEGTQVTPCVANDTDEVINAKVRVSLRSMDGKEITHYLEDVRINPDSALTLKTRDFERQMEDNFIREVFVSVDFEFSNDTEQTETVVFVPWKSLGLKETSLELSGDETDDTYEVTVSSDVFTPFVTLDLREGDAVFSDNCISIFKDRPLKVSLRKDALKNTGIKSVEDLLDNIEIYTLQGSFDMGDV